MMELKEAITVAVIFSVVINFRAVWDFLAGKSSMTGCGLVAYCALTYAISLLAAWACWMIL